MRDEEADLAFWRSMSPVDRLGLVYLWTPPVRIDILRRADGIDTERVLERAEPITVGSITFPIITLEDPITNKRASGRPQDLADLMVRESVRSAR